MPISRGEANARFAPMWRPMGAEHTHDVTRNRATKRMQYGFHKNVNTQAPHLVKKLAEGLIQNETFDHSFRKWLNVMWVKKVKEVIVSIRLLGCCTVKMVCQTSVFQRKSGTLFYHSEYLNATSADNKCIWLDQGRLAILDTVDGRVPLNFVNYCCERRAC